MKKAVLVMIVLSLVFSSAVFAAGAQESEQTTVKLSIPDPANSSVGMFADKFAELVAEKTGSSVVVEVYPDGVLFGRDQNAAINMLEDGGLDSLILSTSVFASFEPRMNAISLPYLFAGYDEFIGFLNGAPGQTLLNSLDRMNIVGLSLAIRTPRNITNSRGPIAVPSDLEGLKIRVPNNNLWVDFFGALGADPTPMNFSEVYTALQLKTIDAQENPVEVPLANKFYEVQQYLSLTQHIADSFGIFMNKDVWNTFDAATQEQIREAAVEAAAYKNTTDIEQEAKIIAELEAQGMQVNALTEEQVKMFQEEAMKIYPKLEEMVGADFVKESLEFLGR
ncbi:MAG: DctP family TRAP transporter solute-binding subunit [Sphaerochaetaceae bacterium]|nr:DctP family TRAP transporter solute-binding subunit [Sphaerochaetaceae bacterium]